MKNKFRMILLYVNILLLLISISYIVYDRYTIFKEERSITEIQKQRDEEKVQPTPENLEKEEQEESQLPEIVREDTESSDTVKEDKMSIETVEEEDIPTEAIEDEIIPTEIPEEKAILSEFKELFELNNDFYGWISIEGTDVNYPVMYTPDLEDRNFYIKRNWQKEESRLGSIYIDGRCAEDSNNFIIYGHNYRDSDSMFGHLVYYKNMDYFEKHKYIEFDTLYEEAVYEIISVSKAVVYYDQDVPQTEYLFYEHPELYSKEEFDDYIYYMKENSYFEIDNTAEYGDKLITLCTCDYWTENARLLIVAKKI